MNIRELVEGLFTGDMLAEQRRLMGYDDTQSESELPQIPEDSSVVERLASLLESIEHDPHVAQGLELSHEADVHSRHANQASGWHEPLPASYLAHVHTAARDAADRAHRHWNTLSVHHEDPEVQKHADIEAGHLSAQRDYHHSRIPTSKNGPKSEPEVYMRRKPKAA